MLKFPKKTYRDKVKKRLETVKEFLDKEILKSLILKVRGFQGKSDVSNKIQQLEMLLNQDIPFILNLLDELANGISEQSNDVNY